MIATVRIDGTGEVIPTSSDRWKCWEGGGHGEGGGSEVDSQWHGVDGPNGWELPGFDDSSWEGASSLGANGVPPWGDVNRDMGMDSKGYVTADSEWIWTSEANLHNDIFCRLVVACGPPPPPAPRCTGTVDISVDNAYVLYLNGHAQSSGHQNMNVQGCTQESEVLQLTAAAASQVGTAFYALNGIDGTSPITVRYQMYTGDGSGADGQCVTVGANSLGSRMAEDGVEEGVSLCFDEYSNGGDHGISIFYNGEVIWEDLSTCGNREGCPPVSFFEDSLWHDVELTITPASDRHAHSTLSFSLDGESYGGQAVINTYAMPSTVYLGFTARTGGATNNHWVRAISTDIQVQFAPIAFTDFTLTGDASVSGWAVNHAGDHYTGCNWQSVDRITFDQDGPLVIGVDALDAGGTGGASFSLLSL